MSSESLAPSWCYPEPLLCEEGFSLYQADGGVDFLFGIVTPEGEIPVIETDFNRSEILVFPHGSCYPIRHTPIKPNTPLARLLEFARTHYELTR